MTKDMTTMKIQNMKSHLLRSLMVVVMLVCGVAQSWGQSLDGYYKFQNRDNTSYYFTVSDNNYNNNSATPYLCSSNASAKTGDEAIWAVYTYNNSEILVHAVDGRAVVCHDATQGEKRIHLEAVESITNNILYTQSTTTSWGTTYYSYKPNTASSNVYLNPYGGNPNDIGLYSNDDGSKWRRSDASAPTVPTPTITRNADGTTTITCTNSYAKIFYTTDGSTPTSSSTAYSGPVAGISTKTVMAIAYVGPNFVGENRPKSDIAESAPADVTSESAGYVIFSGTNYYNATTNGTTSFKPSTCLWEGTSGSTFRNAEGYYIGWLSDTPSTSWGPNVKLGSSESGTNGYTLQVDNNGWGYYRFSGNKWNTTNNNSAGRVVFSVTKYDYPERSTDPTISGTSTFESLTTNQYTYTEAYYSRAYFDYVFYNRAHHYCLTETSDATTIKPAADTFTYTWSLLNEDGTIFTGNNVSVNNNGIVSYDESFATETRLKLKLTATSDRDETKVFTATTGNITFKVIRYQISTVVEPTGWGSVKATVGTEEVTEARYGDLVTLTAIPAAGYEFISGNWSVRQADGTDAPDIQVDGNTCTFTMPNGTVTVTARFRQKKVSVSVNPEDAGTVTVKDNNGNVVSDYIVGQKYTLVPTPERGYEFSSWTVNAGGITIGSDNTFTMPDAEVSITANFTTATFTITTDDNIEGGSITGVPTSAKYKDVVSLASATATPDAGYKFNKWDVKYETAEGGMVDVEVQNDQFTMPAGDVTVSAVFAELMKDPTSLSVTETMEMNVGDIRNITPSVEPSGYTYKRFTYSSANTEIASVTEEGAVTGVAAGQTTITVTAYKQDGSTNADLTKTVTVTVKDKVATPTITFTTQNTGSDADVTFECSTADVDYYYTTDGVTDPTTASTKYNGTLTVSNGTIVKVIAIKTGDNAQYFDNSDVATAQYTAQKVPTPEVKIRGNEVSFTCDEPGVTFYYTTNGNDPTTGSTLWNGNTITNITDGTTIKVIATKDGFAPSEVGSKVFHTAHVVYLDFTNGNDNNDGTTSQKAKKTWAGAYKLLGFGPNAAYLRSQWTAHGADNNTKGLSNNTVFNNATYTATVDNNIIYLVGDVSAANFQELMQKSGTPSSEYNLMNPVVTSGYFKPVTISGKYANSRENTAKYSRINVTGGQNYILNEDMRFEFVEFRGNNAASVNFLLGYYDLEMGEGVITSNFYDTKSFSTYHHGYKQGVTSTAHILFYGGYSCDTRFGTSTNGALNFDYFLPHPDGYKITIRSGFFSTISPGGTQWDNSNSLNGTMGSPNTPVKCTITVDIDRAWNDQWKSGVLNSGTPNCDIAVVIAGTHEGTMYGDVDIIVKSGRIDRVVNGTFGANNFVTNHPADSYFGRANILIDPRQPSSAESATYPTKNSMVEIRELYGGGLGRFKSNSSTTNQSSTYFYGQSSVVINGGTFSTAIYASGAGGVNGVGDDNHYTPDTKLPYWNGNNIAYGTYDQFKSGRATKPFVVKCRNADGTTEDVDLYNTSANIEIHGGVFGTESSPASIYGGGYGFVDTELIDYTTCKPNTRAGAIFAPAGQQASSITIDGDAVIYGNVYGAGRGDDTYKNAGITYNSDDYTKLGHVYGNVSLSIGGKAKIYGNVYGAGQGIDNASLGDMAHLYGNTTLTIGDKAEITGTVYGGGANGATDGTATVNIEGGTVSGDVYGGGALANTGNATLNLTGGTISGNAYGGGLGRTTGRAVAATVGTSTVNVGSSTAAATVINGSVFGCNNLNGYPTGAATVNVYKTAARASAAYHLEAVYGGGNQAAYTGNPTVNVYNHSVNYIYGGGLGSTAVVTGSPVVNIEGGSLGYVFGGGSQANTTGDPRVNIKGGTVVNDVYGGGALANTGNTTVNLLAGTVNNVYGGGLGRQAADGVEPVAAKVGSTTVNIGTGTVTGGLASDISGTCVITGDVFGCNNLNGTPTGEATVNVFETNARPGAATGAYHVNQVFGGGNMASYDPEPSKGTSCTMATHVNVYGCDNSIAYVYGGGNAASAPATNVYIRGGYFDYIFGGGNGRGTDNPGANVGYYTDTDINDITSHGDAYGTGRANTEIYGGIINHLFGGSNTRGNIRSAAISQLEDQECDFQIGEAYAAGNEAYMDGAARMEIGCIPGLAVLYGGAKAANINSDVTLTITSGTYGKVFGGNNDGGCINGRVTVNIEETGCHEIIIGEVYGGGNQAAYPGPLPSNYTAKESGITVNAISFTKIGAIYGGGYGAQATVTGNPTVNVNMVKGKFATDNKLGVVGNVFGGGNAARVIGDTYVNIGTAKQVTFVSTDKDDDSWQATKNVQGANIQAIDVTIPAEITGGDAETYHGTGNVYGGGNQAAVTGKTNVVIGPESN